MIFNQYAGGTGKRVDISPLFSLKMQGNLNFSIVGERFQFLKITVFFVKTVNTLTLSGDLLNIINK